MSSHIIRLYLIIIQVKCKQTTVEFSIHFNHLSEQSLTASRLDAQQIFPNVLISPVLSSNLKCNNNQHAGLSHHCLSSPLSCPVLGVRSYNI